MLETHGAAIRRLARVYAGADGEEEDLRQEILFQLWRGLPSFRGDSAPGTWLYRVALNIALTWRRRAGRRVATHPMPPEELPTGTAGAPGDPVAMLEGFLATLGEVDRSVLLLYMEDLSYQQIADVTGLSASAVGVRVHRIKQAFMRRYVEA